MKKITKNNYEAFLLDFMEGKLSDEEHAALLLFLEQHPEIEFDFDSVMPVLSAEESFSFNEKNALKKTEEENEENIVFYLDDALNNQEKGKFEKQLHSDEHLQSLLNDYRKTKLNPEFIIEYDDKASLMKLSAQDELLIGYSEGILIGLERERFLSSIENNTEAQKDLRLFENTKLVADTTITFSDKESLKRSALIVFLKSKAVSLSIAASLILFFTWFYNSSEDTEFAMSLASLSRKHPVKDFNFNVEKSATSKETFVYESSKTNIARTYINTPVIDNNVQLPNNSVVASELKIEQVVMPTAKSEEIISHDDNLVNINYYEEFENDILVVDSKPTLRNKVEAAVWSPKGDAQTIVNENKKSESLKMNLLALFAKGLQKLGNKKSKAEKIYHEEEGYTEYNVCIAGVTISRKEMN